MASDIEILTRLTASIQQQLTLEQLLQRIANASSEVLDTPRASVRLLDPSRTRLMAVVRAGEPLHEQADITFELGEGLLGWIAQHCQPLRTGNAEADPRFKRRPDQRASMGSFLGVPLMSGQSCVGVLSATHADPDHFTAHHESLLLLLAAISAPHVEIARLARLSHVDPLTGALNRRGLDAAFPDLSDPDAMLSVVMVDVDHFKRLNDTYGHVLGDEVLRRVAHLLSSVLRSGDAVVRYGGEEFLLILPNIEQSRARRVAERARKMVEVRPLVVGDASMQVTASFGVAERKLGETRASVIQRADDALFEAKREGRNRVAVARG